ncbi:MAG: CDGSH iron-sulfur domain-containing protein [Bacteroidota bacterium]
MTKDDNNTLFKVLANGPLEVSGNFRVVNSEGKIIMNEGTVYLCRCGGSANKPFCDGTHKRNGFPG